MKLKVIAIFLGLYFSILSVNAETCTITCPSESIKLTEKESIIKKITGLNFLSSKITETVIEKELHDALKSKFKAKLNIFTIKRLKNGEFKSLQLESKKVKYKAFSMSDFYAETICPYNKIIYKNNRIYYPYNIPFKFKGQITNEDIKNIINSKEFQKEINKTSININGINGLKLRNIEVNIQDDKIHFIISLETFFGNFKIKFSAKPAVENNKIILKDIFYNSKKSSIINYNAIFNTIIDKINPVSYEMKAINGKYCRIYITYIKIENGIIKTQGIFTINKNTEEDE